MRKFCTRKCNKGLAGKNWNQKIVFLTIFTRIKICDSIHAEEGRHRHFGFSDFVTNAESTDAIGVSSVLVLLDLAIHRL
ncbi:hypothetical protein LMTR3_11745 [Bradyrhizobium sp. LMTR 3]|nr:hypothetical protein LMTR3_11745 [Bradyrhizobium sp. LMTR 3]